MNEGVSCTKENYRQEAPCFFEKNEGVGENFRKRGGEEGAMYKKKINKDLFNQTKRREDS